MQITFGMMEDRNRRQKKSMLEEIAGVLDFERIGRMLEKMYDGTTGRPPIPPLMLFKALLLEAWYDLSDVEVVQEIHDRRSFERFVGENVRQYHLDDTTLVRFRERLREHGLMDQIWRKVDQSFVKRGLVVKKGVIVDSTLVRGATRYGSKTKEGEPVDGDVHVTVRRGKMVDGMKVHIGMDKESQLVREMDISFIEEHDHEHFKELIPPGTREVYADKAYASRNHEDYLWRRRIWNGVMRRGCRYRPLRARDHAINKRLSGIRCRIEAKMNDLKRWCAMDRFRYYGLERNRVWMLLCGLAANFKRARLLTA